MDEDDGPIKIQIDNIDEIDQISNSKAEPNQTYVDSNKICNDTEDNSGKIIIPIDFGDDAQEEEVITSFKIPTTEISSKEQPTKKTKSRKREAKENRKAQDSKTEEANKKKELVEEESKKEIRQIKNSIRNFYKLDMQKATLQIELMDPSLSESESNRNYIKAQTIMMLNRGVGEDEEKDSNRELRLDLHCKNINILSVSFAKRYKRVDESKKTSETLHERKYQLEHKFNLKEDQEYKEKCSFSSNFEKKQEEGSIELTDTFKYRASIQNFDLFQSIKYKNEKKKGLLTIDKILCLEPGALFPPHVDIIIDYEITNISDYGLSYRTTNEPSGKGCYLATTHRYFEAHYWIPCIDSLKQK